MSAMSFPDRRSKGDQQLGSWILNKQDFVFIASNSRLELPTLKPEILRTQTRQKDFFLLCFLRSTELQCLGDKARKIHQDSFLIYSPTLSWLREELLRT